MNVLLSIVIVEYNSKDEILHCASSLQSYLTVPYEILVSSNSCYDDKEKADIDLTDTHVRWLFNDRNGGFAYAMNEGLKVAQGKYMVIMNSDCTLNQRLDCMIAFMERHPEVGVIAPQIRDGEGNIQDTARPYVSLPRFVWRQIMRLLKHEVSILNPKMDYSQIQTVDWVIGAFMMVSREAYQAAGGLDDNFFMYAEDLDWCTRIRLHGFEVVYYPEVTITYKGTRRARSQYGYAKIFLASHIAYWKKFGFFYGYPKRVKQVFKETE